MSIGTVALASLLVLSALSALGQTLPEIARVGYPYHRHRCTCFSAKGFDVAS